MHNSQISDFHRRLDIYSMFFCFTWWASCRVLVGVDSDHYPDVLLRLPTLALQAAVPTAAPAERDQPHRLQRGSQQLSATPLPQ